MDSAQKIELIVENLTDEQVLKEFVKRFKVDGAILLYKDGDQSFGFTRWRNKDGRIWANSIMSDMGWKRNK